MSPVPIPQVPTLTYWQQWQYFSNPRRMHDLMREKYGPIAPLHFQGRRYALLTSPEGARQAFSADPEGYDAFWKESFAGMNGENSLWVLIGEPHRRERALFAPAVHARHFRQYGGVIRDIARQKITGWQAGQTLRAIDTTLTISLEVIMRLVFGVEGEAMLARGRAVIHALTHSAHPLIVFYPQLQRPWFPLFRRYTRAKAALYAWMDEVIAARRARADLGDDVLASLLGARDEAGRPYADEHIRNELLSVLTAGHMTTAVALAWALYELGRHPAVTAKLRAELATAGPDPDPIAVLTLPYLSAICNETIRLHPILAECARVPMQPIEILDYTIPAGQALVISIVGIHHDPGLYPEPDAFRPERFIERAYERFEFLPFGGGHRRCLGAGLAEYTLRLAVAEIAGQWDFEAAAVDRDIRHDLAMGPKLGAPLRLLARRRAAQPAPLQPEPLAVAH